MIPDTGGATTLTPWRRSSPRPAGVRHAAAHPVAEPHLRRAVGLDASATELRAVAWADATGFFYIAVCDRVTIPAEQAQRMGDVWYDTVATSAGWRVDRARALLSHVYVAAYRHPLLTARAFSTLDELSGGRPSRRRRRSRRAREFERWASTSPAGQRPPTDRRRAALGVRRHLPTPAWVPPRQGTCRSGSAARPTGAAAAGARGDGWLPQGTPEGHARLDRLPASEARAAAGRADDPIDIGAITGIYYVGEPSWDVGSWTTTGSGEPSPSRSGASPTSASTTPRSGSAAARSTSCSTRWTPSTPRWRPTLNG